MSIDKRRKKEERDEYNIIEGVCYDQWYTGMMGRLGRLCDIG